MTLYEITTGSYGCSHCRAYAWAASEAHARELFAAQNPSEAIQEVRRLMSAADPAFCTAVDDEGWPAMSRKPYRVTVLPFAACQEPPVDSEGGEV